MAISESALFGKSRAEIKDSMNSIWLISYLALWAIVAFLLLAVFVLARQVGLLHRRIGLSPARMENAGPKIGELVPELKAFDLDGREVSLGSDRSKRTLLVFISATCSSCDALAPALRSVWKSEGDALKVILVSLGGDEATNRNFITRNKLGGIPYIVSTDVGFQYSVLSPPYGLLIDEHRVLRAKGVVNHLEHLESLFNAANLGHPSLESYVAVHYEKDMPIASRAPL